MTKPYAEVIGDPIAHSKSPLIHNFWLEKLGIDAEYRACHVRPEELADYFARRREDAKWRGCNVTIPHKQAVMAFLDALDPTATRVGAVNTIVRNADGKLSGTNTDVDGVQEALQGLEIEGREAIVIGAGGAARAAFVYLADAGCSAVRVLARNPGKAREVVEDCRLKAEVLPLVPGSGAFANAALAINATQLGMPGQSAMPDFILDELQEMADGGIAFDMVYAPNETEFLKRAQSCSLYPVGGLTMLVGQARTAFARFFGKFPPHDHDAELQTRLAA